MRVVVEGRFHDHARIGADLAEASLGYLPLSEYLTLGVERDNVEAFIPEPGENGKAILLRLPAVSHPLGLFHLGAAVSLRDFPPAGDQGSDPDSDAVHLPELFRPRFQYRFQASECVEEFFRDGRRFVRSPDEADLVGQDFRIREAAHISAVFGEPCPQGGGPADMVIAPGGGLREKGGLFKIRFHGFRLSGAVRPCLSDNII